MHSFSCDGSPDFVFSWVKKKNLILMRGISAVEFHPLRNGLV
jgi:hypothetical protein